MPREALIIGSHKDCCHAIKEFLELRDLDVTLSTDYKTGIDKLFEEKPALCVIEISEGEISPGLIAKIRGSSEFSLPDFTEKNQTVSDLNQVFILDDTNRLNTLLDYFKVNLPGGTHLGGIEDVPNIGNLKNIFYPILLVDIYRRRKTGILSIFSALDLKIYFKNGSPVYAEGGEKETMIGQILVNIGRIDPETHRDLLERSRKGKTRVGEILIDSGLISPHELSTYLELQIEEKILRGFCTLNGDYSFRDEESLPLGVLEYNVELPKVMNEAVKRYIYAEKIEDVNPQIKVANKTQSIISNMELKPKELRIVQLLKNNMYVKDILGETRLEKYKALKLLYLLGLFKAIELPGVSLESIGRQSVERYLSENKIAAKVSQDPDIKQEGDELIELEREVLDSKKAIADWTLSGTQEIYSLDDEDPGESISEDLEDIQEIIEIEGDLNMAREDSELRNDEDVASLFRNSKESEEAPVKDYPDIDFSAKSAAAETAGGIAGHGDSKAFEIVPNVDEDTEERTQINEPEEVILDSKVNVFEIEEEEGTNTPLELENSTLSQDEPQAQEPPPVKLEINTQNITVESPEEPEAQEIGTDLFSRETDNPEMKPETEDKPMQETPKEISIDDSDLFSSFENEEPANEAEIESKLQAAPLTDEQPEGGDSIAEDGDAFTQRIFEFHNLLPGMDYYQILGVSRDSPADDIKNAYYELVKDYHPDVNKKITDHNKEKAQEIFTAINSAYETLSDGERREDYNSREQMAELKTQAQSIYEAEVEFKRGLTLLTQRNYAEAVAKLEEALKMNPNESAYIGAYAWARFLDSDNENDTVEELIKDLRNAIDINSSIAENYYYLGSIYKSLDDMNNAEQNYQKALDADPNYLEAKRELRLIQTRKRKDSRSTKEPKIEKRFWSSLFKK